MKELKGLYVITDETLIEGRKHKTIAEKALKAGAKIIQLRDKYCSDLYFFKTARRIKELCDKYNGIFIINDRIHIAMAVDADGVNIGQNDLPLPQVRKLLGPDKIIGVTCKSVDDAVLAEKQGADYLGVGPIFSTQTKLDAGAVIGPDFIKELKENVGIPIAAIGGINERNIDSVVKTGADMICVISAVVCAEDPEQATLDLVSKLIKK
ncbi:MAG: thiamine phosphate synthase [Abditibacteriota bacterium]|nr:thiamine phosphate synthase [Abditibacteriota bacterium]